MGSEIFDIPSDMQVFIVALFLGVVVGIALKHVFHLLRHSWTPGEQPQPGSYTGTKNSRSGPWSRDRAAAARTTDAADQLRIVMEAGFSAQPLLNKGEARVFKELDAIVTARNPRWLVMAQVSLGEILRGQNSEAHSCINSKRVDLLLVDENCNPRHVVEYQGHGHHQGSAAARDAVKKEALRRAGIGYHEVVAGKTTPAELKQLVQRLVDDTNAHAMPNVNRNLARRG